MALPRARPREAFRQPATAATHDQLELAGPLESSKVTRATAFHGGVPSGGDSRRAFAAEMVATVDRHDAVERD